MEPRLAPNNAARNLGHPEARAAFEHSLERVRKWYGLIVTGYVVMPEHVHLLVSEPERSSLAVALQMLKQIVRKIGASNGPFWQRRYYDFNLWSERKPHREAALYASQPGRTRISGEAGTVEIESEWTARKKERMGAPLRAALRLGGEQPHPPASPEG